MTRGLKAAARAALALIAALIVGMVGAVLFGGKAHAQTPAPMAQWTGAVQHLVLDADKRITSGCVAGWRRSADRYGDHDFKYAYLDLARVSDAQQYALALSSMDVARLASLRTVTGSDDPALQPCLDKLQAPVPAWTVAPLASGKRPAYLLKADGTRGAQQGTADTTITGEGKTGAMWCNCKVRSTETTSSTYCAWATARQTFDPAEPQRVTLCRAAK